MANAVVVTGSAELNAKLAKLKSAQAKAAIRKASREALRPVAVAAKANAPRRSGRLSRSIKVKALERSRIRIGSRVTTGEDDSQFKGKQFYGGMQEYGWKAGRRVRNVELGAVRGAKRTESQKAEAAKRNNSRPQISGTRFMNRAAESKKQLALSIYKAETTRWIEEFARKA